MTRIAAALHPRNATAAFLLLCVLVAPAGLAAQVHAPISTGAAVLLAGVILNLVQGVHIVRAAQRAVADRS